MYMYVLRVSLFRLIALASAHLLPTYWIGCLGRYFLDSSCWQTGNCIRMLCRCVCGFSSLFSFLHEYARCGHHTIVHRPLHSIILA